MRADSYIEHWLKVLAEEFSMYLYRTDDGHWCVSPDSYMSDNRRDPHQDHPPYRHHDGSPSSTDLHRDTIREAIDARREWLIKGHERSKADTDRKSSEASRRLALLGGRDSQ